jgi:hypothetical protein
VALTTSDLQDLSQARRVQQDKGRPLYFGSVRRGKVYLSFYLMPIYMCAALIKNASPELKKRMQGKTCFNIKTKPEPALITDLTGLTEAGFKEWNEKRWCERCNRLFERSYLDSVPRFRRSLENATGARQWPLSGAVNRGSICHGARAIDEKSSYEAYSGFMPGAIRNRRFSSVRAGPSLLEIQLRRTKIFHLP